MKNKLLDLNNHLFEQLERLNDEAVKDEQLEQEIKRAKAVSEISKEIIATHRIVLDAHLSTAKTPLNQPLPKMLGTD